MSDATLIEYPCDFPLKIVGHARPGYAQSILETVQKHAPDFDAATMEMRPSTKGKYLSLTCTIRATSREQIDALYVELGNHPMVVWVL